MKLRTGIFITILALFSLNRSQAQNYVEIGTGTIANTMPIYSYWNYSWSSLIYNHTDLGTAKTITKIALNCTNGPKSVTNQKLYFKLTPNTTFANANYEDPLNTGYTLAFSGDLTFVTGWNEITLTTPIPYDGVQNLAIHWEDRWGNSYGPVFNSTASTINNNKNCGNDQNFPLPSQTGYLNPYPSSLTNMRFYYAGSGPATPTNPVPADNATVVSISTNLSWVLGANTTSYDLYFGTDPLNLPLVVSNAPAGAGTYTYTPSTLLADSTMHYWKVVAKNGSMTEPSPIWKFKTEVVIDQFPYNEGFEDSLVFNTYPIPSAWLVSPDVSWYQYDTLQQSGSLCAKSSYYVTGNQATLRSPKVLLPPNYMISYFWRCSNSNKTAGHDTTYFEVTSNGGQSWVNVDMLSPGSSNPSYIQRTHNLSAFAGNNCYFRFRHVTDNGASASNIYLDDISIYSAGSTLVLQVTPPNQNVPSPAGNTNFNVVSNSSWTVVSDQSWCTVPSSGSGNGNLQASFTENTGGATRIAHITVTVTGIPAVVVTVTQSATLATLSVDPQNQNVPSAAGSTTFNVTTQGSWTASSNESWCTVTASGSGNGVITANYTENTATSSRVAEITVSASGLPSVIVTVTQNAAGAILSVSPPNQNVTAPAGTTTFSVTSNAAWTASSDQSWCTVTSSGSGNSTITASYSENTAADPRVAQITVTVSGLPAVVVTVTQEGTAPYLGVTPPNQAVTYQAGTTNFSVSSNVSWTAVSDAAWCVVTASGSGVGTIFATYAANSVVGSRVAHITVTGTSVNAVVVTVTQDGPQAVLSVSPAVQQVTYPAGVTTFVVTSNSNWTAGSDAAWCFTTASGSGSGILYATYLQNDTQAERTANITLTDGQNTVNVQVVQQPMSVGMEVISSEDVQLYPNPAVDVLHLRLGSDFEGSKLEVLSMTGAVLMEASNEERFINLTGLGSGSYLLKITNNGKIHYKRFIVR